MNRLTARCTFWEPGTDKDFKKTVKSDIIQGRALLDRNTDGRCKMFTLKNIEVPGQVTYSSEIYTFLFWEIERQTYPRRKITIRRRTA